MCGRFGLITLGPREADHFGVTEWPHHESRYNIAPGTDVLAVAARRGERAAGWLRWGLRRPEKGTGLIVNIRGEGLFGSSWLGDAGRRGRCLIPASHFYEWQAVAAARAKQPYAIAGSKGEVMALGGVYVAAQRSELTDGRAPCAVVTTRPNSLLREVHDRMPVIVAPENYAAWLNPETSGEELKEILKPIGDAHLRLWRVSTRVNRSMEDDMGLVDPV